MAFFARPLAEMSKLRSVSLLLNAACCAAAEEGELALGLVVLGLDLVALLRQVLLVGGQRGLTVLELVATVLQLLGRLAELLELVGAGAVERLHGAEPVEELLGVAAAEQVDGGAERSVHVLLHDGRAQGVLLLPVADHLAVDVTGEVGDLLLGLLDLDRELVDLLRGRLGLVEGLLDVLRGDLRLGLSTPDEADGHDGHGDDREGGPVDSTDTRKAHAQLLHIPRRLPGELTDSGQGRPTAHVRADSPHTHGSPARRGCLPHIRDISAVRPMTARSAAHTPGAQAPTLGVDEGTINFTRRACRAP